MSFLTYSLKFLPLAICYAVWMGLALLIQTLIDIFVFHEVITRRQIGFMILVLIGIVGLQVSFKK
jgi:multidrug transporter EmrE-like cation transporter